MRTLLTAILCVLLLGACAKDQVTATESSAVSSLTERATYRWERIGKKDWYGAYDLLSPATRSALTGESYAQNMSAATINWLGGTVEGTECEIPGEVCEVTVRVRYLVTGGVTGMRKPVELSRPVQESWINVDGAWYFVPDSLR